VKAVRFAIVTVALAAVVGRVQAATGSALSSSPTLLSSVFSPTTPSAATATSPSLPAATTTVSVRARLEPDKRRFHLDEIINLYVELSWIGGAGDVVPETPDEPTLMNLAKKDMSLSSRILPGATPQKVVVTYHYLLEPIAEGAASIEPIEIPYRLKGESEVLHLSTGRFALTILPRRWPWKRIAVGVIAAVLLIGGGVAGARAFAARRKRLREEAEAARPPSPFELMRGEVEAIRKLFTEGATKQAYDAVERLVRRALGEQLGEDLRAATTSELTERLGRSDSLDGPIRDRAASILDRCAEVKFAGYSPTVADQDRILADCSLLLDDLEKFSAGEGGEPKE